MKQCHQCGAELKNQVKFCPKCGTKQEETVESVVAAEHVTTEPAQDVAGVSPVTSPAQAPQSVATPEPVTQPSTATAHASDAHPEQPAAPSLADQAGKVLSDETLQKAHSYVANFFESLGAPGRIAPDQPVYHAWVTVAAFVVSTYLFLWSVGTTAYGLIVALLNGRLNEWDQFNVSVTETARNMREVASSLLGDAIGRFTLYVTLLLFVYALSIFLIKRYLMAIDFKFSQALQRVASYLPAYILVMVFYALFARLMPASLVTAGPVLSLVYLYFLLLPALAIWANEASSTHYPKWYLKIYYVLLTYALILMIIGVVIAVVR